MATVVDISCNLRGHVDLPLYDYYPEAREKGRAPWNAERLVAEMDRAGVDKVGVLSSLAAQGVGGAPDLIHVDEVKPLMDFAPDRIFGIAGVEPHGRMDTVRYIEYAVRDLGFKGLHIYPHWWGVDANDRLYYPIYAKAVELGIPVAMQMGQSAPRSRAKLTALPHHIDDVCFDFPELKLCCLHNGHPYEREFVMLARMWEHLYIIADAHRPSTWHPEILAYMRGEGVFNVDGGAKVMWGTDWPVQDFGSSIDEVKALGLPADLEAAILGENALRIFDL